MLLSLRGEPVVILNLIITERLIKRWLRLALLNNKLIPRKCLIACATAELTHSRGSCCRVRVLGWPLTRCSCNPSGPIVAIAQTSPRISDEQVAQYTKLPGPAALTFLKARAAHLSRMFFVGRHLFSSLPLAVMQALKSLTSDWQNLSRMS